MLLDSLNEQQYAAVTAPMGPVLVLAGPGSGKTRVLTYRIAYLIEHYGIHPPNLMAVTFTNKAAGEMRGRVEQILNGRLHGLNIGTFHAICARLLRREHEHTPYGSEYVIFDTDDQNSAINQAVSELNLDPKKFNPRQILNAISNAKNELIEAKNYPALDYKGEVIKRVYTRYQAILLDNNAMDFDDLLMQMALLLRDNDVIREKYQRWFEYVLVDEFQDTNTAQYQLVQLLAQPDQNVFVVGDEDQGIYAFRGADYRNVLQFRRDYPQSQVILLEQNYRSKQTILEAARAVIDRNPNRTRKQLFTDRGTGERITLQEAYNEEFEAKYVLEQIESLRRKQKFAYKDFAVMYRTNAQSRALEDAFIREAIPYKLIGGVGFYKRVEIRDLLAYLRVVNNPNDKVSFTRIINTPKRGIGQTSLAQFQSWAAEAGIGFSEALEQLVNGITSPIGARSLKPFVDFGKQLRHWRAIAQTGQLVELLDQILADTKYRFYLSEISDDEDQAIERSENVKELRGLLAKAQETQSTLGEFLAEQSLVADVDALKEGDEYVTLLTLHAAKGLEYPVVFIAGVEEGLIPHTRSFDDPEGMAEERRLFYVGITRAADHLYLTYTFKRSSYGMSNANQPSRFLADIPQLLLQGVSPRVSGEMGRERYAQDTRWERTLTPPPAPRVPQKPLPGNSNVRSKITPFPTQTPNRLFKTGQRVRHAQFGVGLVIESKGSGDGEEVFVAFEDKKYGVKQFLASFGSLTPLKD
ncbi:MAG: UvrD-helicase domain-containing protein [Anaerolineae bacterium]|jgi:DNA helicase-2/ATP-dependent DNA helicase PcrA|nr:UvrD-helicase domain-containing protein [Anaerolineae bacterium]